MAEWINPRYAALVEAWRDAQEDSGRDDTSPVRGFIFPDDDRDAPPAGPPR